MEDVLVFLTARDKWKKVNYVMKKWKRKNFVLLKMQIFFSTDKLELISLSNIHGIHIIPLVPPLKFFKK